MKLILQKAKQKQLNNSVIINEPTNTTVEMNVSPKYLHSVLSYYYDLIPFYSSKRLVGYHNKYPINSIYYKYLIGLKSWIGKNLTPDIQVPTAVITNSIDFNKDFSLLLQYSKIDISTAELDNPTTTFRSFVFNTDSIPFIIIDNNHFSDVIHITNPNFKMEIFMKPNFSFELSTTEGKVFGVTTEELAIHLEELHFQFDIDNAYVFRGYRANDILPETIDQNEYKKAIVNSLYNTWVMNNNKGNQSTHINIPEIELISKGSLLNIPILIPGENISSYTTLNRILNCVDKFSGFTKLNTTNKRNNLLGRLDAIYNNYLVDIENGFKSVGLSKEFFTNSFINSNLSINNSCYVNSISGKLCKPMDHEAFHSKEATSSLNSVFFEHIINNFPFNIGRSTNDEYSNNMFKLIKYWMCIRRITGTFDFIFNCYSSLTEYYFEEEKLLLSNYILRIPKNVIKTLIKSIQPSELTTPLFTYKESNTIKKSKKVEPTTETTKTLIDFMGTLKGSSPELDATINQIQNILNKDNDGR